MSAEQGSLNELGRLKSAWQANKTVGTYHTYVQAAAAFMISLAREATDTHWFCDSSLKPHAVNSIALLFDNLYAEAMPLQVEAFKEVLAKVLSCCAKCGQIYQQAAPNLVVEFQQMGIPEASIRMFYENLHDFDKARLTSALHHGAEKLSFSGNSEMTGDDCRSIIATLTEVLFSFPCLFDTDLLKYTCESNLLSRFRESIAIETNRMICPGYLVLAFNGNYSMHALGQELLSDCRESLRTGLSNDCIRTLRACLIKGIHLSPDWSCYNAAWILDLAAKQTDTDFFPESIYRTAVQVMTMLQSVEDAGVGTHYALTAAVRIAVRKSHPNELSKTVSHLCEHFSYQVEPQSETPASKLDTAYSQLSNPEVFKWIEILRDYVALHNSGEAVQVLASSVVDSLLNDKINIDEIKGGALSILSAALAIESVSDEGLPPFLTLTKNEIRIRTPTHKILQSRSKSLAEVAAALTRENLLSSMLRYHTLLALNSEKERELDRKRTSLMPWESIKALQVRTHYEHITKMLSGAGIVAFLQYPRFSGQQTKTEEHLAGLFELLCDVLDQTQLIMIFENQYFLTNTLLVACSANRGLAFAAESALSQCRSTQFDDLGPTDLEGALAKIYTAQPKVLALAVIAALQYAGDQCLFCVMPGALRLATTFLTVLYSPNQGDARLSKEDLISDSLIVSFWIESWRLLGISLSKFRGWSERHGRSAVKDFVFDMISLGRALLDHFQDIQTDTTSAENQHRKNDLAKSTTAFIENMSDLLKLADPELLTKGFNIILETITIMIHSGVSLPEASCQILRKMAKREIRTRLSNEQLADLLAAAKFPEGEIQIIISNNASAAREKEQKVDAKSDSHARTNINVSGKVSLTSDLWLQTKQQQKTVMDFFKPTGSREVPLPPLPRGSLNPSKLSTNPEAMSRMDLIRLEAAQKHHWAGATKPQRHINAVIHPARPAGFNPRIRANEEEKGKMDNNKADHSSESSDDDSDKNIDESLFEMIKVKKPQIIEPNQIEKLKPEPLKETPLQRTMREKADARKQLRQCMNVNSNSYIREVLSWDYYHEGDLPIGMSSSSLVPIPSKFSSTEEYERIMRALLKLETWEEIRQGRENANRVAPIRINLGQKSACDGFTDVHAGISSHDFESLSGVTLLLLTCDRMGSKDAAGNKLDQITRPTKEMPHCFALIKDSAPIRKRDFVDIQLRMFEPKTMIPFLNSFGTLIAQPVCSLVTAERQYCALESIAFYGLQKSILLASPKPIVSSRESREQLLLQKNLGLNRSQAFAVEHSLSSQGISLIQGPPGTGKTKTILGLISAYFSGPSYSKKKLLVCTPSNAAVDELLLRLKAGITDTHGKDLNLSLLRIGNTTNVNPQVKDLTLSEQINKRISNVAEPVDDELANELKQLIIQRDSLRQKLTSLSKNEESLRGQAAQLQEDEVIKVTEEMHNLSAMIRGKGALLDRQKSQLRVLKRKQAAELSLIEQQLCENCNIFCCTLTGSAHSVLKHMEFPMVVIDEAAQCIELSSMIPLKYACKQLVLVGDPNQLPPTVLSQTAVRYKYDQSLFVRMFSAHPDRVCMLNVQFRMHPEIAQLPSSEFYENKLTTGHGVLQQTARPWHAAKIFGPYRFYSVCGFQEKCNTSLRNTEEAEVAVELVRLLFKRYPDLDFSGLIGIVSPYKEQVNLLKKMFVAAFGNYIKDYIDINSVDGFQGQEKDIIIFSCVRGDEKQRGIGFLADRRRINVAVTRARASLWIIGNSEMLQTNALWRQVIADATSRGVLTKTSSAAISRGQINFISPASRPTKYETDILTSVASSDQPAKEFAPKPGGLPGKRQRYDTINEQAVKSFRSSDSFEAPTSEVKSAISNVHTEGNRQYSDSGLPKSPNKNDKMPQGSEDFEKMKLAKNSLQQGQVLRANKVKAQAPSFLLPASRKKRRL